MISIRDTSPLRDVGQGQEHPAFSPWSHGGRLR
jgi:hypothetical protein